MKAEKRTFVFHLDWAQTLKGQPNDIRLAVYDAIIDYVENGIEPSQGTAVYLVFLFIKQQIDKDAEKYAETCEKRRNAGAKGGKQKVANATKRYQKVANVADNDNEYEYDNDIIINDNSIVDSAEKSAPQKKPSKTIEERECDFMELVGREGNGIYPAGMLQSFFNYWSEKNANGRKMRFEMQKTFDVKRRLSTWANNENKFKFKNNSYGNTNDPTSVDYVSTDRIVAAGRAMANATR